MSFPARARPLAMAVRAIVTLIVALLAAVLVLVLSVVAMLGVATLTSLPTVFVGAGLVVLGLGFGILAWLLVRRSAPRRRLAVALITGLVAVAVGASATGRPLGDPRVAAEPVAGMQLTELPTGSRLAWVRVPGRGTARGAPIVFVHGGPGTPDMAHDLAVFGELAQDGHEVVLYDEIGTGHSARLADPREYTLERDVADLEALVTALDVRRPILIGHSYGGSLIAAYAARHPDAVSGLVFLAPGAIRPGGEAYSSGMRDRLDPDQTLRLYARLIEPRALLGYLLTVTAPRAAAAWIDDAEFDARFDVLYALTSPGLVCDQATDLPEPHQLGFFTNAMARRIPDLRDGLGAVHVPTLILKPQCDYLPWSFGTDVADAIDGSLLVYIEGAGHSLYVEQQEVVLAEIRAFLAGRRLPVAPWTGREPPADLDGPIGEVAGERRSVGASDPEGASGITLMARPAAYPRAEPPVRVKVTWVTPLGELVASMS